MSYKDAVPERVGMELADLADRLDDKLKTADYADVDASANGLQVGPDGKDVEHVAFAVDGAQETFKAAAEAGTDALVVHHGLSWGGFDRVTGRSYDRIAALVGADLALYVSHLPLDGHQRLGNAAGVARLLGLESREPFGELGDQYVGQQGTLAEPRSLEGIRGRLDAELDTAGKPVETLEFGPEEVERVAIVTGSGADWLGEAADKGADVLITGEGKQQVYHEAREAGVSVVLAGHYATETFGVRSLADLVSGWGLETTYIDAPTGL